MESSMIDSVGTPKPLPARVKNVIGVSAGPSFGAFDFHARNVLFLYIQPSNWERNHLFIEQYFVPDLH